MGLFINNITIQKSLIHKVIYLSNAPMYMSTIKEVKINNNIAVNEPK